MTFAGGASGLARSLLNRLGLRTPGAVVPPPLSDPPQGEGRAAGEERREERPPARLRLLQDPLEMPPGAVLRWVAGEVDVVAHGLAVLRRSLIQPRPACGAKARRHRALYSISVI